MTSSLPSIDLSFSTGKGKKNGAWDDSELVSAYDAALQEFHIHHPGPGSWLDKATAALAKGKPFPGANAFGTAWYSSYSDGMKDSVKRKRENEANQGSTKSSKRSTNPYDPFPVAESSRKSGNVNSKAARLASPTYQPLSPSAVVESRDGVEEDEEEMALNGHGYEDEQGNEDEEEGKEESEEEEEDYEGVDESECENEGECGSGEWIRGHGEHDGIFPTPGASWPIPSHEVGYDEALGYALNAQYWAGYWMGLARGVMRIGGEREQDRRHRGGRQGAARQLQRHSRRTEIDVDEMQGGETGHEDENEAENHSSSQRNVSKSFTSTLRR